MPKVQIDINANDNASSVLLKVTDALNKAEKGGSGLSGAVFKGNVAFEAAKRGLEALTDATVGFTQASLKSFGQMEQNEIALKTMLGSSQKMYQVIADVQKAALETPFEMQDLVTGTKRLIAFGEEADTVVDTMKMIGDVASGVGIPINDLITKYGQLQTQGRATAGDLREFAGRGVPIYSELAKVLKTTESNVIAMTTKGKVGFAEVQQAFRNMTGEGGKFHNLMEAQSKSLEGQLSNLSDAYDVLLVQIGRRMEDEAKRGVAALNQTLKEGGLVHDVLVDMGRAAEASLGALATMAEVIDENYRNMHGTAKSFEEGIAYLEDAAILEKTTMIYTAGLNRLFGDQAKQIENTRKQYQMYLDMGIKGRDELEKYNTAFDEREAGRIKSFEKHVEKEKDLSAKAAEEWRKKRVEAVKYYKDLVYNSKVAQSSELERIELAKQKELEAIEEKKSYLREYYEESKSIVVANAERDAQKQRIQNTADMLSELSSMEVKFFTQSASAESNAVGQMSQDITSNLLKMSGDISKIMSDIAADAKKTGMSVGDAFKIGASVAVTALNSISAVLSMQNSLVQASYNRQIQDLESMKERELELLEESYEALEENTSNTEELRRLQLQAYADSLAGMSDAEIEYAVKKKQTELESAKNEKETNKKREAEQKKINQQYALEKWKLEVEAFKAQQSYEKSAVVISTAVGIVNAWSSAMRLPFPANVAVGGALTAIMVGTAAKQVSLIDAQKPPAPPKFAEGVTNFEGGWAIVGEKGPELRYLDKGTNIYSNEQSKDMLGGPRYLVNNIYVNGVLSQQDIVDLRKASAYGGY